jgi:hypothetical protein
MQVPLQFWNRTERISWAMMAACVVLTALSVAFAVLAPQTPNPPPGVSLTPHPGSEFGTRHPDATVIIRVVVFAAGPMLVAVLFGVTAIVQRRASPPSKSDPG